MDIIRAGNNHRTQPILNSNCNESKDVRASTLPRRRGTSASSPRIKSPQKSPDRQSPCASTPSVDSAVGSAEGLGVHQSRILEELRPRSDGSDSLATSSALTSPEPSIPTHNQEGKASAVQESSSQYGVADQSSSIRETGEEIEEVKGWHP